MIYGTQGGLGDRVIIREAPPQYNYLINTVIELLATPPTNPVEGYVYFNTVDNILYVYSDGAWLAINGAVTGVTSVNTQTGVVVLDADDIDDTSTTNKFVTATELTKLSNLSGTNTGDQILPTRDSLGLDTDDTVTFANLSGTNTGDQDVSGFVPYTGATTDVVLGANTLSTTDGVITPKIYPASNSTTAIQINKADGTTNVLNVDTTNSRVGLGTTAPTSKLDITTNSLGTTQTTTSGLALVNTTTAAAGAQQISPALRWTGYGWKTNATATSQEVSFIADVLPVQGSVNPSGTWRLQSSVNASVYKDLFSLNNGSGLTIGTGTSSDPNNGTLTLQGYYNVSQTKMIISPGGSNPYIQSSGANSFTFRNSNGIQFANVGETKFYSHFKANGGLGVGGWAAYPNTNYIPGDGFAASGVCYIGPTIGSTPSLHRLTVADTTLAASGTLNGSLLNLTQTWNTTGTPTAVKLDVTDTASNAASLLMDLQVGGNSKFKVTKNGQITASKLVEANTAGSGSPNIITSSESGSVFTNEGTTSLNYHTLPIASAGLTFTFIVQDNDGIRITANTGNTIRVSSSVSGVAGYAESTTIGSSLTLIAINSTEWVATSSLGTWTLI